MTVVVVFFPPHKLMSMNDRDHWRTAAVKAKAWRYAANIAARAEITAPRPLPACWINVQLPVTGNRRRDPANYALTVKHIVDGLVDAGCWPDDTPEWVTTTEPTLSPSDRLVRVTLTPRAPA